MILCKNCFPYINLKFSFNERAKFFQETSIILSELLCIIVMNLFLYLNSEFEINIERGQLFVHK
jgi:hypothetical protein